MYTLKDILSRYYVKANAERSIKGAVMGSGLLLTLANIAQESRADPFSA